MIVFIWAYITFLQYYLALMLDNLIIKIYMAIWERSKEPKSLGIIKDARYKMVVKTSESTGKVANVKFTFKTWVISVFQVYLL